MSRAFDLRPEHEIIVRNILRETVPDARVFVFGSRAKGAAKPYSDLDLAIDAGAPLTFAVLGALAEAFDASDLPIRVDVVDLCSVDREFRLAIESHAVALISNPIAASG